MWRVLNARPHCSPAVWTLNAGSARGRIAQTRFVGRHHWELYVIPFLQTEILSANFLQISTLSASFSDHRSEWFSDWRGRPGIARPQSVRHGRAIRSHLDTEVYRLKIWIQLVLLNLALTAVGLRACLSPWLAWAEIALPGLAWETRSSCTSVGDIQPLAQVLRSGQRPLAHTQDPLIYSGPSTPSTTANLP